MSYPALLTSDAPSVYGDAVVRYGAKNATRSGEVPLGSAAWCP